MQQSAVMVADTFQPQLAFARHNYDTQQGIIRQLDTKAAVFITLLVFLATTTLSVSKDVCTKIHWSGRGSITSWIYFISILALVIGFVLTAICVLRVIRPRGSEHANISNGLMFAVDILRYGAPDKYHAALEGATDEVLLKNLTEQIFQLSVIVQRKTEALAATRWPAVFSIAAWAVNSVIFVYMLSWR